MRSAVHRHPQTHPQMKRKPKAAKARLMTENYRGWGLRVGGWRPYLAGVLEVAKADVKLHYSFHRPVRVVLLPLEEYRRLIRPTEQPKR